MGSTLFPLWCDVFARAVFYSPIAIAWGCTLFRRLGAVGSTAPSLGGGVPVSRSCLGVVSVCFGGVPVRWYLVHVSLVSRFCIGGHVSVVPL